jgi:hypothetical protein
VMMKMVVFWDVVPCSLVLLKHQSIATRLHDKTSQKTVIFLMMYVSNAIFAVSDRLPTLSLVLHSAVCNLCAEILSVTNEARWHPFWAASR